MLAVPLPHVLLVAALLFSVGLFGLLARRNLLVMLVAIELMLGAAGLAFIAGGARWSSPDGQVMFLFMLAVAASEVAVGLALLLRFNRLFGTLDADAARRTRG